MFCYSNISEFLIYQIHYQSSSPRMCKTWTPFPLIAESNMSLPDIAAVPTAMGVLEEYMLFIFLSNKNIILLVNRKHCTFILKLYLQSLLNY